MKIKCVWEHNGNDSLLYATNYIGAFTRGETKEIALSKMQSEVESYLRWKEGVGQNDLEMHVSVEDGINPEVHAQARSGANQEVQEQLGSKASIEVVQEHLSSLDICDADSDVLFDTEKAPLTIQEYLELKALALKSAEDFLTLYEAIPDKHSSVLAEKKTFLGPRPRTAFEMYEHTKSVNSYYFGEIDVEADNEGNIYECRARGFELLEQQADFLNKRVIPGSYDEEWSLRKVLRRFIWHDRIHAKAMYRMACKTFAGAEIPDVFRFES